MPKVNINGIGISYQVSGEGEPVIFIMGLGGPGSGWFFQTHAFSKHYRMVVFDNRGVGKSSKPSELYTVKTMADDTIGLMDHLGFDRAHIIGTSLGGMIAQELAINHPGRVDKLVLVCTTADTGNINDSVVQEMGLEAGASEGDLEALANKDLQKVMGAVTSLAFNRRSFRLLIVPLFKLFLRFIGVDGIKGQLRAANSHSTLDRLHQIKAPTLVIAGTNDRIIPFVSSETIAEKIPGAKLVSFEGGSHAFFVEMSGRFNKVVLDFLKEG
jgi:pimeloyl-ACP methyl ester carboxylesterase